MKKAKKTTPSDLQAADNIEDLKEKIKMPDDTENPSDGGTAVDTE